jgi:hypothetical protein
LSNDIEEGRSEVDVRAVRGEQVTKGQIMSIAGRSWDAFISYAHKDGQHLAQEFANILDNIGLHVFLDDVEILPADILTERISEAIHKSRCFVSLVSQAYLQSGWCRQEMLQMLTKEANANGVYIIIIRIGDCTVPRLLSTSKYFTVSDRKEDVNKAAAAIISIVERDYQTAPEDTLMVRASVWIERMCELASLARRCISHILRGEDIGSYSKRLEDICGEIVSITYEYTSQIDPKIYDLFRELQVAALLGIENPEEVREDIERCHSQLVEILLEQYR